MTQGFTGAFKTGSGLPNLPKVGTPNKKNPLIPIKDTIPGRQTNGVSSIEPIVAEKDPTPMIRPNDNQATKLPATPDINADRREQNNTNYGRNTITPTANPVPVRADVNNTNKRLSDMEKVAAAFEKFGDANKARSIRAEMQTFKKGIPAQTMSLGNEPNV